MRHPGLTVGTWILFTVLILLGVLTGFFFTYHKSDLVPAGVFVLVISAVVGWLCSLIASGMGNGEVITNFPGEGDHDMIFGGTYRVLSCTCLKGKLFKGEDNKFVVVLEDAAGALWSCVLPEEPPTHFVYTKGEKPFTPYATTATATATPTSAASPTGEAAAAS